MIERGIVERLQNEVDILDRHFAVLEQVIEEQPIGIRKLSDELGYPHHNVRYSLRMLEEVGIIEPTDRGAVTTAEAATFLADHAARIDAIIDQLDALSSPVTETEP